MCNSDRTICKVQSKSAIFKGQYVKCTLQSAIYKFQYKVFNLKSAINLVSLPIGLKEGECLILPAGHCKGVIIPWQRSLMTPKTVSDLGFCQAKPSQAPAPAQLAGFS